MHCKLTLQKTWDEKGSSNSSTCQPGKVSIKYSDMPLIDTEPSWLPDRSDPLLWTLRSVVDVDSDVFTSESVWKFLLALLDPVILKDVEAW